MIGWSPVRLRPGEVLQSVMDMNDEVVQQPCVVVREATADEFMVSYKERGGDAEAVDADDLNGIYFYEVCTD